MSPVQNSLPRCALSDADFARQMAALGPYEPNPVVAVAVSGGADSLALVVLADRWARQNGGHVISLTVDHGLNTEAAAAAMTVQATLATRGIDSRVLVNTSPVPDTGVEAYARAVRYRLLRDACHAAGVLHLLVAHTMEDQAETVLIRLGAGSGEDGLAAISPIVEVEEVRILRPLLEVPKDRLCAVVDAAGMMPWSDPMNSDERFRRVRVRKAAPALRAAGLSPLRLAEAASGFGRARLALEVEAAKLIAHAVSLSPLGYASADLSLIFAAEPEIRARVLARLTGAIGGREFPPSPSRADAALQRLLDGDRVITLGGCVITQNKATLTVCREVRGRVDWQKIAPGEAVHWDGRFDLRASERTALWVRRAGNEAVKLPGTPHLAVQSLPLIRVDGSESPILPHLMADSDIDISAFRPRFSLSAPGVTVV